jgi:hypothetical protein
MSYGPTITNPYDPRGTTIQTQRIAHGLKGPPRAPPAPLGLRPR